MSQNEVPVTLSAISATESTGCHILKLSGYSQAKLLIGAGEYLASTSFEAAGHSWRIVVYPNGNRRQCDPGCISLGLMVALMLDDGESQDVHARVQFSFVRHGSKLTGKPHGGRVTVKPVVFQSRGAYRGFRNVGEEELQGEPAAYIKDDAILIRCDITVFNKPAAVQQQGRDGLQALMELFCDCDDQSRCINLHACDDGRKESGKLRQSHDLSMPPEKKLADVVPSPPLPSASTIAITASTGCHIVKVSGYWRTRFLLKNGTPFESAEFKVAGHTWRIRYHPNGDWKGSAGYMSLYLVLASEATDVHARFHFSLLPHGKLTDAPHGGATTSTVFPWKNYAWGFMAFMSNAEVEETGYLNDDSIFIRCDITVLNKPVLERHDLETLHLLCDCKDDLCKNLHREAAASCEPSWHVLKKMLLGCLPI